MTDRWRGAYGGQGRAPWLGGRFAAAVATGNACSAARPPALLPVCLPARRYECSTCRDAGATFNLCQDCWDQWQGLQNGGASSSSSSSRAAGASPRLQPHLAHAFQHVGPKLTRHGAGSGSDDTGWRRGAPVPARALQRLSERTGVRHWG